MFLLILICDEDYTTNLGIHVLQTGAPQPLHHAQADLGFAHVPEQTCKDLLIDLGVEVPENDEQAENDYKTAISLALLAAIKPDLTDLQAVSRLNKAFVAEHPDCYSEL